MWEYSNDKGKTWSHWLNGYPVGYKWAAFMFINRAFLVRLAGGDE